jgi:hypothetical protein
MPIGGRFLPKGVNLRFTTVLDYLRKARRFHFEKLHILTAAPGLAPYQKKPARELRQGGSDYRCCIPALAGFVSPQSIAPDGEGIFPQHRHHAIAFCKKASDIDKPERFCLHRRCEMAVAAFARASFRCGELVYHARESSRSL